MIGILFATEREARPFLDRIAAIPSKDQQPRSWSFETPGGFGGTVVVCGVGKEKAAAGADYLISTCGATEILNAGICGGVAGDLEIGKVFRVSKVRDGDSPKTPPTSATEGRWGDLPTARLTSCTEPVFDDRREVIGTWGQLVDMEGSAIADICSRASIPFSMLKGVSDRADQHGPEAIRKNLDTVSQRVADAIVRGLEKAEEANEGITPRLLRFTKIEHTVFSIPLLFTGAWFGADRQMPSLRALVLIMLAGLGARVLGMAMNRILDRRFDAINPRTARREIPSGQLSVKTAGMVAAAGLAVYLTACVLLGPLVLALSPIPAGALIGYSLLKRFTALCHYGIGVSLALAPLGAFVAVSGSLEFNSEILLLTTFAFCWISGFDIIYALQDLSFDRAFGVHSIPAAIGSQKAQLVAAITHGVALASITSLLAFTGGGPIAWIAWAIAAGAFVYAYLPSTPLPVRFFPTSAVAGIAGSIVPLVGRM